MKKKVIFLILVIVISCTNKTKIIPKDDLINILADIHLADATVDQSNYKKFHQYDTIILHKYIFDKYGYKAEDFDSTMAYYSRDLDKIKQIYEKVMEQLQRQRTALADSNNIEIYVSSKENIWNLKSDWKLPRDGKKEQIEFKIPIKGPGRYTFKADIKIYKDDESQNPRLYIYITKEEKGNSYGRRNYFETVFLVKDEIFHSHMFVKELKDTIYTHIKGQILSHTNISNEEEWEKHAEVKNIVLYYEPMK